MLCDGALWRDACHCVVLLCVVVWYVVSCCGVVAWCYDGVRCVMMCCVVLCCVGVCCIVVGCTVVWCVVALLWYGVL